MRLSIALALIACALVAGVAEARTRWCGSYARTNLVSVDPGPEYNLACKWRDWGSPTHAREGAMVVWCSRAHRHVGKITGPCDGDVCVVTSGNDGGRVRTRARSVAGAEFRI